MKTDGQMASRRAETLGKPGPPARCSEPTEQPRLEPDVDAIRRLLVVPGEKALRAAGSSLSGGPSNLLRWT
jgi:hypothetical protein